MIFLDTWVQHQSLIVNPLLVPSNSHPNQASSTCGILERCWAEVKQEMLGVPVEATEAMAAAPAFRGDGSGSRVMDSMSPGP